MSSSLSDLMEPSSTRVDASANTRALSNLEDPATQSPSPLSSRGEYVALATTKRKFHKLLDGITGASPRPKATSKDPHESVAKRIRLEARSRLTNSSPQKTPLANSASIQSQVLAGRLAAASTIRRSSTGSSTARAEPNYLPWNHDQFLRRLKTFTNVRLWTPKPDKVNEVEWAKRGWICVDWNTVACKGGCEQRLVIGLRPGMKDAEGREREETEDLTVDVDDELVGRYVDLTITGHDESCLWRGAGCKDDIFRLPIAKASLWQSQLRDRYHSFHAVSDQLPHLSRLAIPIDLSQISQQLPTNIFQPKVSHDTPTIENVPEQTHSSEAMPQSVDHGALAFALLGWTGSQDPTLASCDACFRRLGLWLYSKSATDDPDKTRENAASEEDENLLLKLDLVDNHRDYCPWVNATSQKMPGSFAGLSTWQILVRLIANNAIGPSDSTDSLIAHLERHEGTTIRVVNNDDEHLERPNTANSQARTDSDEGAEPPVVTSQKDAKQVEKEDKARFAKLKDLTKLLGLRKSKPKKP